MDDGLWVMGGMGYADCLIGGLSLLIKGQLTSEKVLLTDAMRLFTYSRLVAVTVNV